jgi:cation diffusion facilitator CzcD-associated flavoprotein CzcO
MPTSRPDHEILIIGAGFSGIGAAIELTRNGFTDFIIVDDSQDYGGTWYWNRYPGVAVDIPSYSYQYGDAPSTDWSRTFAPGWELRAYARRTAMAAGLPDKTRFSTRVVEAAFDGANHYWRVNTDDGGTVTARYVIDATGSLTTPKMPEIDGVTSFCGTTVHTARWDESLDLRGKRVAVIGTGASAVQVIPTIAPYVDHLTVFQRTPVWCIPKADVPVGRIARTGLDRIPGAARLARALSEAFVESLMLIFHYDRRVHAGRLAEAAGRAWIRHQVHDRALHDKLTPRHKFGCKRPTTSNSYYRTFNRDNVALQTDPIARVTEDAIVTASGTTHPIDVLVLATGFKVFDPGNFPKYPVTGVNGVSLEAWWRENRLQAYEGVSVPGFPNYFNMFGPYGYNGSSYFNLIDAQKAHITRILRHARDHSATYIEIRQEANQRYFVEMMRRRRMQAFWDDSCRGSNSYYFDEHGDVPFRPSFTREVRRRANNYPLSDYQLEAPSTSSDAHHPSARQAVANA